VKAVGCTYPEAFGHSGKMPIARVLERGDWAFALHDLGDRDPARAIVNGSQPDIVLHLVWDARRLELHLTQQQWAGGPSLCSARPAPTSSAPGGRILTAITSSLRWARSCCLGGRQDGYNQPHVEFLPCVIRSRELRRSDSRIERAALPGVHLVEAC
jgi:hypothetical protein